jgi:peptidoglycan hydrolase-like protein with peptidoglycan-binding domain
MSTFDASGLQRQLITRGFLDELDATGKSNVDKVFGTVTQAALVKYQESAGLPPTGQPDDATMQSLGMAPKPPEVVKWALPTFSVPAVFGDYVLNWLTSKTAWASTAGAVLIIGVLNGLLSRLGIQLDNNATVALSAFLLALLNGVIVPLLHSVFNRSKVVAGKVALKAETP